MNAPESSSPHMSAATSRSRACSWASALGVVSVVLGLLLSASYANEWLKQSVMVKSTPASGQLPPPVCLDKELEDEGLSRAECEALVAHMQTLVASTPAWFPRMHGTLSAIGVLAALLSVIVGLFLANGRAATTAIAIFAALMTIDIMEFIAFAKAGPMLASAHLWNIFLWFMLHLMMLMAALAGFQSSERHER